MMTMDETEASALCEALPNLVAGDRVAIHEPECATDDGEGDCDCSPIVVYGPSGKA